MSFIPSVPTYTDLLETIHSIEQLLYQFQSEVKISIVRHIYPYVIEIALFSTYHQFHIHTVQQLLNMQHKIEQLLPLVF